ncbi:sugar transferase [bacterium]|nr:sugar transferase [bacterium]MDB4780403.1 sugar transferase [bacterium]
MSLKSPPAAEEAASRSSGVRLWGLEVGSIYDGWWRSKGVQVVMRGSDFTPDPGAEVFLLVPPELLVVFDLKPVVSNLVWNIEAFLRLTVVERNADRYREEIRRDETGAITGVERRYDYEELSRVNVTLTTDLGLARNWVSGLWTPDERSPLGIAGITRQKSLELDGQVYQSGRAEDEIALLRWLVATWDDPSSVMVGIDEVSEGVFAPHGAQKMENVTVVPPAWIGFQRAGFRDSVIAGPEFLGDTTPSPPRIVGLRTIREVSIPGRRRRSNLPRGTFYGAGKRSLDLVAASFAMLLLAPLYLLIAILIHRFDGRPILFRHVRQGRGGREFKCLKFRTMRNDAEEMAQNLGAIDQSDGPQVFILDDPRVTRLGRFLRMTSLDEIPQFWNVFRGHMSIVGPRPSPERENQFCPAWREARLSVRPGITGLWQVRRTRAPGRDFQEWIRYDLEYVRRASFLLDMQIVLKTFITVALRLRKGN